MTPRQRDIYLVIDGFWREYGYGPSVDEVMYIVGAKGRGNIHRIMTRLCDLGYCKRNVKSARTVRPLGIKIRNL